MSDAPSAKGDIRYCVHALITEALAAGWRLLADFSGTHHGVYSAGIVIWDHDRPAPWPPEPRVVSPPLESRTMYSEDTLSLCKELGFVEVDVPHVRYPVLWLVKEGTLTTGALTQAETPIDVETVLDRGRQRKAEIAARGRDETALVRIERSAAARLRMIARTVSPQCRARMLGELADWIMAEQQRAVLDRLGTQSPLPKRAAPVQMPAWVPDEMAGLWRAELRAHGELAAAAKIRAMKRGRDA